MGTTPVSLLDKLRLQPLEAAWVRFHDLYTPFIRSWLGRYLAEEDVDDLAQEVMKVLVTALPKFRSIGFTSSPPCS